MNPESCLPVLSVTIHSPAERSRLLQQLVANGLRRLDETRSLAILTGCTQRPFKRLLYALSRHDHQAEVVKGKHFGWRFVPAQSILQRTHHARAVSSLFHVDQIQHDDSAKITQPNLSHNLIDRLQVSSRNCIFKTSAAAADKLPGVDVDRHQGLSLVNDEV